MWYNLSEEELKGVVKMKKKTIGWIAGFSLLFALIGYGIGAMSGNDTEPIEEPIEEVVVDDEEEQEEVVDDTMEVNQTLADWMPRLDNVQYQYEGFGNEYAAFNWVPQFNQENYYQIARDNGGTTVVEIYEYREDEIVRVFSRPETYFRDNFMEIGAIDQFNQNEVVLKQPIEVGTNWSTDVADYEITAIEKEITVPAGNYPTVEVTIEQEGSLIKRYYAEDIGLVYEWTEADGFEVESKLATIEKDIAETIPLTVYQSDDQIMGIDRISTEIKLNTNDSARIALQELLTGAADGFEDIYLLPDGTKINYLFLNNEDVVEVDLSKEYIQNMNAGSSGESFYLTGLGNTLSTYYGVENVLLTIDGENYEGGHIILKDGEYISYDDSIVNE